MMEIQAPVFEEIYRDYLAQLGRAWSEVPLEALGVERAGEAILVPFYGQGHRISPQGIIGPQGDKPSHARCVTLARYLLARPRGSGPVGQWSSYREFADAAPYAVSFSQYAEGRIAKAFSGRRQELAQACAGLGGRAPAAGFSYDLCLEFTALPKMPLLLLFNDQEEGFPASCSLLLDQSAPDYLDMECLAIVGLVLAEALVKAGGQPPPMPE